MYKRHKHVHICKRAHVFHDTQIITYKYTFFFQSRVNLNFEQLPFLIPPDHFAVEVHQKRENHGFQSLCHWHCEASNVLPVLGPSGTALHLEPLCPREPILAVAVRVRGWLETLYWLFLVCFDQRLGRELCKNQSDLLFSEWFECRVHECDRKQNPHVTPATRYTTVLHWKVYRSSAKRRISSGCSCVGQVPVDLVELGTGGVARVGGVVRPGRHASPAHLLLQHVSSGFWKTAWNA